MVTNTKIYSFGDFTLDCGNKRLLRGGEPVPLTPKVFETLLFMVENSGRLLQKDELMEAIWKDSFVEESNLAFNIRMLRKALDDSVASPVYIETVPRRGYRFKAAVSESNGLVEVVGSTNAATWKAAILYKRPILLATLVMILLIPAIAAGWLRYRSNSSFSLLSTPQNVVKLSDSGAVRHSVVSHDGKFVVYTSESGGKESLRVRQLATGDNSELLAPTEEKFYGLTISKSGDTVYFVKNPTGKAPHVALYSLPFLGGAPTQLSENVQGWISISPDDRYLSFVRYEKDTFGHNLLVILDLTTGKERIVSSTEAPDVFWAQTISPDGKKIAAAYGHTNNASNNMRVVEVDIATGNRRDLYKEKFYNVGGITWLPDQSGLLLTAGDQFGERALLRLDYADGSVKPLVNNSISYNQISIDRDVDKMVVTTVTADFGLYVGETGKPETVKRLTQARDGFDFTSDGRAVYASDAAGGEDIWISNLDGTNLRQLTVSKGTDAYPRVSPDNRYIYFSSNRTGKYQIWRMNMDGGDQTQLTTGEGGYPRFISPDGWLYYVGGITWKLYKVSADGVEDPQPIADQWVGSLNDFSPDGTTIAYAARNKVSKNVEVALHRIGEREPFQTFEVDRWPSSVTWAPDGSIVCSNRDSSESSESQAYVNGKLNPVRAVRLNGSDIHDYRISKDGKTFGYIGGSWKHDALMFTGLK